MTLDDRRAESWLELQELLFANTCAMPLPMVPAPITPTFLISMIALLDMNSALKMHDCIKLPIRTSY